MWNMNNDVQPMTLPSASEYLPAAYDYVKNYGEFQFRDLETADRYAKSLMVGEGGQWQAKKLSHGYRAVRVA